MRGLDLNIFKTVTGLGVAVLLVSAVQAETIAANWTCHFTTECFEQEACNETDYDVEVSYDIDETAGKPGHGAGSGKMTDVVATRRAVILHDNGAFFANAIDTTSDATIPPSLFQIFAAASGDARLISATPADPLLITYYGSCKAEGS